MFSDQIVLLLYENIEYKPQIKDCKAIILIIIIIVFY